MLDDPETNERALDETDHLWLLSEAAKPSGFTPHSRGAVEHLGSLEFDGLVRQSDLHPVWFITERGRAVLAGKSNEA